MGRNLAAGIGGSAWAAVVGIATVPIYIRYLGMESYGLIGFFTAMQGIAQILDLGLAPTISREVARCQATGALDEARALHRTLAYVYWATAVLIAIGVALASPTIGAHWLNAHALSPAAVVQAVALMGVIIAVRWPLGLYLGALQGSNRLARASLIAAIALTAGSFGAIAVLAFVSPTIEAFFLWQAGVSLVHIYAIRRAAWGALGGRARARFDPIALRRIWRFAAGMGVVALLGMLFSQLDKLLLSKLVGLDEVGRYTLAGLAGSSLQLLVRPVISVVNPRLAGLVALEDTAGVLKLYLNGTRLLLALLFPLALFVGVFAVDLVTVWTGNATLALRIAPVVRLLLLGFALNSAMYFPYSIQLAYGRSRLPAIVVTTLIVGFVPLLWLLATRYGALGAAGAWAVLNIVYVPFGTWITHRELLRGHGLAWLLGSVMRPLVVVAPVFAAGAWALDALNAGLWPRLFAGTLLMTLAAGLALFTTPAAMEMLREWRRSPRGNIRADDDLTAIEIGIAREF